MKIELVDSWHKRWPDVLTSIEALGGLDRMCIDEDGWLSSRQCVLVAIADAPDGFGDRPRDGASDRIVGHLVFSIQPTSTPKASRSTKRAVVEAALDTLAIEKSSDIPAVREALIEAATLRARMLRCAEPISFVADGMQ